MTLDPKRLNEELDLKAIFDAAHADVPDAARRMQVFTGLERAALGATAAGAAAKAAKSSGVLSAWWVKAGLVGMGTLGAGVAAYHGVGRGFEGRGVQNAPIGVVSAALSNTTISPLPEPIFEVASASSTSVASSTPMAQPQPVASRRPEVQVLDEARHALAGDPGRALSLCTEHAKGYPHGALIEERERIAIEALLKLGRTQEAQTRAARFFVNFPHSTYRSRLSHLLGEPSSTSGTKQ